MVLRHFLNANPNAPLTGKDTTVTAEEVFEENPTISRKQAVKCVESHSCDVDAFFYEMGDQNEYSSRSVLEWLGY